MSETDMDRIQASHIVGGINDLTRSLMNGLYEIEVASAALTELCDYHAIEYVEGTEGADIRRHLEDAARSLRAAAEIPPRRRAEPGELCTCGEQAEVVYLREDPVGYCGRTRPSWVSPCPWCGTVEPHLTPWGDPERCPDYTLRPNQERADDSAH